MTRETSRCLRYLTTKIIAKLNACQFRSANPCSRRMLGRDMKRGYAAATDLPRVHVSALVGFRDCPLDGNMFATCFVE